MGKMSTQVRSMGTARSGVAAAALDGLLYVVGGWDGMKRLRIGEVVHKHFLFISTLNFDGQVYNPSTNQWRRSLPKCPR